MSKPRYAWWGYMINIIRRYPERRQALAELRHMKVTVNYEASGHGGGGSERWSRLPCGNWTRRR